MSEPDGDKIVVSHSGLFCAVISGSEPCVSSGELSRDCEGAIGVVGLLDAFGALELLCGLTTLGTDLDDLET